MSLEAVAQKAYQAWSITLVETGRELHGPCPFCGTGKDRFIVWPEGNYWCRVCEAGGRVPGTGSGPMGRDTLRAVLSEKRAKQDARLREWQAYQDGYKDGHREGSRTGYIAGYHAAMKDASLRAYWLGEGITDESIERYQLGYCAQRTFEGEDRTTFTSPAYTLPHYDPVSLELVNCQYRILDLPDNAGGKYRQEPGLPPAAFYTLPKVVTGSAIVVEGGKKAIVLSQVAERRIQTVGLPGITPAEELYLGLEGFDVLWLWLDPGPGRERAVERAQDYLGDRVRVVVSPAKPDDAFVRYGLTKADLRQYLAQAR